MKNTKVKTCGPPPLELTKAIAEDYEKLYQLTHNWHIFETSLEIFLAVLNNYKGDEEYFKAIDGLDRGTLDIISSILGKLFLHFVYNQEFYDILGSVYTEIAQRGAKRFLAQHFTPWHVARLMAMVTLQQKKEKNIITVCDPCCGSGIMLLAAKSVIAETQGRGALRRYRFYGQDIDPICVNMCKIQMLLTDDFFMKWYLAFNYCKINNLLKNRSNK